MSTRADVEWSLDRLERFARTCALRDRSARRAWVSDELLELAIRGYAHCIAVVTRSFIVLTAEEVDIAIRVYRRARRLKGRSDLAQRALITVVQPAA